MPDVPLLAPLALAELHFLGETVVSSCIRPHPPYAWPKLSNQQNLLREVQAAKAVGVSRWKIEAVVQREFSDSQLNPVTAKQFDVRQSLYFTQGGNIRTTERGEMDA